MRSEGIEVETPGRSCGPSHTPGVRQALEVYRGEYRLWRGAG